MNSKKNDEEDSTPTSDEAKQLKRLQDLIRHKRNVLDATELLGMRLIEYGEFGFAKQLIARGYTHDHSKFFGIEWDLLHRDVEPSERKYGYDQHVRTNEHHPQAWGGIDEMPRIAIAEMVCDWKARSTEMGTDLRSWFKDIVSTRHQLKPQSKTYKQIRYFIELLLDPTFK